MAAQIVQLKITLQETKPAIWRRIHVPADVNFRRLHQILNITMGWEASHLWCFSVGKRKIGDKKLTDMDSWENDIKARLKDIVGTVNTFEYEYDFGDRWIHGVAIEEVLEASPDKSYPFCVAGENVCPPENCGGPGGFEGFKEAMRSSKHKEHEDMLEWYGKQWDTFEFETKDVNIKLSDLKKPLRLID